jgi:hypothetical protein
MLHYIHISGPSNWLFINTQCADILQSPVPLTDKGVSKGEYKEKIRINGLSNLPDSMSAENDGHSGKFTNIDKQYLYIFFTFYLRS